jgi:hypothetical protein
VPDDGAVMNLGSRMSEQVEYRDVERVTVAIDGSEEAWSLEPRSEPEFPDFFGSP